MFQAAQRPPIPFEGFANATFDERLVALTSRSCRIAYYYDKPDLATFRYRVINMVQALGAWPEGGISASWFSRRDLGEMQRFIDRADALVICRALYTSAIDRLVTRAKARRIPVLFDCDDLVFDTNYVPLLMQSLDLDPNHEESLQYWYARIARYGAVMRLCDRAIATNSFLAGKMGSSAGHIRCHVIPNFLHGVQQAVSAELYAAKRQSGFQSDGTITIGYFSGSPTHDRDFAVVAPALTRLLDKDARIRLRVVGFLGARDRLDRYGDRVEFYPVQDPINLQRLIAETEINIAPLQNNLFTNCKSELKYFEAAAAGTLTVATPTYTFSRAIVDGENGFLANAFEWDDKLQNARDTVDNPSRYAAMAQRAFDHADSNYGWNRQGALIAATVFDRQSTGGPALPAATHPAAAGEVAPSGLAELNQTSGSMSGGPQTGHSATSTIRPSPIVED
jgi:glycosyltransferase involved in cell wall biosynthesis